MIVMVLHFGREILLAEGRSWSFIQEMTAAAARPLRR
jgi:hypothetical protein